MARTHELFCFFFFCNVSLAAMYSQPDTSSWFASFAGIPVTCFEGRSGTPLPGQSPCLVSKFQVSGFRFLGAGRGDSVLGENRSKLSDLHTNRSDYKAILDSSDSLLLLLTSPLTCFSSSCCLVGCWLGSDVPGVAWVKQRIIPRFHRILPQRGDTPGWARRAVDWGS